MHISGFTLLSFNSNTKITIEKNVKHPNFRELNVIPSFIIGVIPQIVEEINKHFDKIYSNRGEFPIELNDSKPGQPIYIYFKSDEWNDEIHRIVITNEETELDKCLRKQSNPQMN